MEKKLKILIVDDERFYIHLLVELLKDHYKIYIAKSGEHALTRISDNQPDLILLDIMMPEMDGYQTCQAIKKNPEWIDIPVIFLTANTDKESEAKAFTSGAIDFIKKPIDSNHVISTINKHLPGLRNVHDII